MRRGDYLLMVTDHHTHHCQATTVGNSQTAICFCQSTTDQTQKAMSLTTTTTILRPLYRSICVSWHPVQVKNWRTLLQKSITTRVVKHWLFEHRF